jgi:uncharacterized membrane protein YcaP (DUF421 family)
MWDWLLGDWRTVGFVALSTILIYGTTVLGMRASERRTIAEASPFDLVVVVGLGAIVGRTATAESPSYVQATVAVATLVVAHRLLAWTRLRSPRLARSLDRLPLVLVRNGEIVHDDLVTGHLTEPDLWAMLRQHGVRGLDEVLLVVLEHDGQISVVRRDGPPLDPRLLADLEPPRGSR